MLSSVSSHLEFPFLIGFRSWNSWFHRDRTPVRWQKDSLLNKHHDALELILTLLWCPLYGVALFLGEHRHFEAKARELLLDHWVPGLAR